MSGIRLGGLTLTCLIFLSTLALLPGLGSSRRLTYHEAFVAQGREKCSVRVIGSIQVSADYLGWRSRRYRGGWSVLFA